jgi:hypothetical protein
MLEMQGSIREADARIQVLHAAIGNDLEASKDNTVSVWEAIAAVKQDLEQVTASSESNAAFLTQARTSLPTIRENLKKLSTHYMQNMPRINKGLELSRTQLSALEAGGRMSEQGTDGLSRGETDMFGFSIGVNDPNQDHGAAIRNVKNTLEQNITDLRVDLTDMITQAGGGAVNGGRPDLDNLALEILERLGDLEARTSGEGLASGNHVFNSETSVSEYLIAKKVPNAGCFWDLFSVLACMSPKRQRGKDKANKMYSAKRINSTQLDNDLLAAMTHERPDVLYTKRVGGKLGSLEEGFVGCPSYKVGSPEQNPTEPS